MRILIDSSVLIESEIGRRPELLQALLGSLHSIYINPIVASEYFYKLIGILAGKSPMSVCESGTIKQTLDNHNTAEFLGFFNLLSIKADAIELSLDLMKAHNLLPNDALILATCKLENVAVLASYDTDFAKACQAEGIQLVAKVEDL